MLLCLIFLTLAILLFFFLIQGLNYFALALGPLVDLIDLIEQAAHVLVDKACLKRLNEPPSRQLVVHVLV